MKKNPISQATVVPVMEQAKLFTQKKVTGTTLGSLERDLCNITLGKSSKEGEVLGSERERERERACVCGIRIGSILVLGKQLGGVEVAWI